MLVYSGHSVMGTGASAIVDIDVKGPKREMLSQSEGTTFLVYPKRKCNEVEGAEVKLKNSGTCCCSSTIHGRPSTFISLHLSYPVPPQRIYQPSPIESEQGRCLSLTVQVIQPIPRILSTNQV